MSEVDEIDHCPVVVLKESSKGFFLRDKFEFGKDAWFPKSQVSFERRNLKTGDAVAQIPLWLLNQKGWL